MTPHDRQCGGGDNFRNIGYFCEMPTTITLTPDQQRHLESEVAAGRFPSIEAAVSIALDNFLPGDEADLDWARPLVDQTRADVANGDAISGQEAIDLLDRRIHELQGRK